MRSLKVIVQQVLIMLPYMQQGLQPMKKNLRPCRGKTNGLNCTQLVQSLQRLSVQRTSMV